MTLFRTELEQKINIRHYDTLIIIEFSVQSYFLDLGQEVLDNTSPSGCQNNTRHSAVRSLVLILGTNFIETEGMGC